MAASCVLKTVCMLLVFLLFLSGLYELIENLEPNKCEMTYMYEMPEYIVSVFISGVWWIIMKIYIILMKIMKIIIIIIIGNNNKIYWRSNN